MFFRHIASVLSDHKWLTRLLWINVVCSCLLWMSLLFLPMIGLNRDLLFVSLSLPASIEKIAVQPWSIVTYMFVQISPLHLIFNMITLFFYGAMTSGDEGDRKILMVYIGSGLGSAVFFILYGLLITPGGENSTAILAGASGAVIGIMGFVSIKNPQRHLIIFPGIEAKLWQITLILLILSFLGSLPNNIGGLTAHLGGLVTGFVLSRFNHTAYKHKKVLRIKKLSVIQNPEERLDELLDKISMSGYDSLSDLEKNDLLFITERLKIKK